MRLDTGTDRPHVAIERAAGDNDIGRKSESLGPFGAEFANGFFGGRRIFEQTRTESGQQRIERREEFLGRQTIPPLVPHGLVSGSTTTADDIGAAVHTCQ